MNVTVHESFSREDGRGGRRWAISFTDLGYPAHVGEIQVNQDFEFFLLFVTSAAKCRSTFYKCRSVGHATVIAPHQSLWGRVYWWLAGVDGRHPPVDVFHVISIHRKCRTVYFMKDALHNGMGTSRRPKVRPDFDSPYLHIFSGVT